MVVAACLLRPRRRSAVGRRREQFEVALLLALGTLFALTGWIARATT